MSMQSSFIYGYGFPCECQRSRLCGFIESHKSSFLRNDEEKELYDRMIHMNDFSEIDEVFESYSCDNTGREGVGAVIANIMSRETGIRFAYCPENDECDTEASIVFAEGYPWQLNENEKRLTEEKLSDICKEYMDELRITDDPDYLNLEYYG